MFWKNSAAILFRFRNLHGAGYSLFFLALIHLFAPSRLQASQDTLFVKRNDLVLFNDSLVVFEKDTFIVVPPGVAVLKIKGNYDRSRQLYDSLQVKASRKKWVNRLYRLVFVPGRTQAPALPTSLDEYRKYEGWVIRTIRYYRLDPFGAIVRDTLLLPPPKGSKNFLNKVHITTRWQTIRKNLLFEPGDPVDPQRIDDNERLLRHLPYIRDARFLLVPVGDHAVDVLIITRDVFSLGGYLDYKGINAGGVSLVDKNFLGLGDEIRAGMLFNFRDKDPLGCYGRYKLDNMFGSFISGDVRFLNAFGTQSYSASFQRPFLSQFMANAGGLKAAYVFTHEFLNDDTVRSPIRFSAYDAWYARSILLNSEKRRRIVFSGRYHFNDISNRPDLEKDEYYKYQEYQLFLAQVSVSTDRFYKTSLIYNYGTTEDIPEGILAGITGGYELNEFVNRWYLGAEVTAGRYFRRFGYLNAGVTAGGFHPRTGEVIKQGVVNVRTDYFSPLFPLGRFYFRQFINIDFTTGINRYSDELLTLNDRYGIRGLRSDSLRGVRRLAVKTETVAFSPYYFFGFRFVFFTFADLGVIDLAEKPFTYSKLYSGFGLGIRIRNENLIFNTFQIRVAYYPVLPASAYYSTVVLSGEKNFNPYNFTPHRPEIIDFR